MIRLSFILLLLALVLPVHADQQFELVTPQWVAAHANDPSVRILDVRIDFDDYFVAHVPNAVHMPDNTVRFTREGVPAQYLPVDLAADVLMRAGVKDGQTVVVYSDGENAPGATMIAYTLEKIGHQNVKFLDGGWTAYKSTQKTVREYPKYQPGKLSVHELPTYVTLAEVRRYIGKNDVKFIDTRPHDYYTGRKSVWVRSGHIPGATNIPLESLMESDNQHKYKSVDQLKAIFDSKGFKKTDNLILYCGTGREATIVFMALKHLLGYPNVRLYEGAWVEYSAHPELPIETGDGS